MWGEFMTRCATSQHKGPMHICWIERCDDDMGQSLPRTDGLQYTRRSSKDSLGEDILESLVGLGTMVYKLSALHYSAEIGF